MSPSPFGDYGGNSDAVVARLEFAMPTDAESKLANIGKAVESVKTSWEAVTRFTKEYTEYMRELPEIEKKIKDLHATQTEGLKASTEALAEASEAGGEKQVSTPISTGARIAGAGAGQPVIPSVDPPQSAKAAHEHLTDEDRTKPEAHRHSFQESSAPPPHRHDTPDSAPAPAHRHDTPDSASPPAHYHERPDSAPPPSAYTSITSPGYQPITQGIDQGSSAPPSPARPHIPVTPPAQHQPQAAPVVGHSPVVHVPTVPEANEHKKTFEDFRSETQGSYTSSNPTPVARPPVPVPLSEQPRPSAPIPTTSDSPSPQQPILPPQTEFGSSVPPPPIASTQVAQVLSSRPPTATLRSETRPEAQYPIIPPIEQTSATYDTPARSESESPRDDRQALQRPSSLSSPSLSGQAPVPHSQTSSSSPAPVSTPHSIWSARPANVRNDSHSDGGRDGGGSPAQPGIADVAPPAPARPHTPTGAPPPVPGHDRVQTHDAAQPVQPAASPGGAPPRVETRSGAEQHAPSQNVVIRAENVKIDSQQSHVQAGESHVRSEQSTVHAAPPPATHGPSIAETRSSISRSDLVATSRSPREGSAISQPEPPTTPAAERRLQDLIAERQQVAEHGVPGSRVIGHIPAPTGTRPATHQTQPAMGSTTPTQGETRPTRAGQAGAPQPTSGSDYRQKLGGQLKGNPAEIYDRLKQRGMTNETEGEDGEKQYSVQVGNKTVPFEAFQNDESLQDEALDSIGQQAAPQGQENAGPAARAMYAGGLLKNIGQTVRHGGDATGGVEKLGSMVSSIGKGGGAAAGVGAAIGGAARFMGPVGMGVAAATGANALIQGGGEKVQDLYNQGTVRGGGVGAGAKIEAGVAAMALNPFISNEQSRQVIMGALNTGAQGPAYDSITGFIKDNLTNMNVSVADSTKMLDKNVKEGGQSIESLGIQLGSLSEQAKTGSQTLPQLQEAFMKRSGDLVSQGTGGTAAGKQAQFESEVWNQQGPGGAPNPLAGQYGRIQGELGQSDVANAQMGRGRVRPGTDPRMVPSILAESGQAPEAQADFMQGMINKAKQGPEQNWPTRLMDIAEMNGTTLTVDQAKEILKQGGGSPTAMRDETRAAQGRQAEQQGNVTEDRGPGASLGPGGLLGGIGASLSKTWNMAFGSDQDVEKDEASFEASTGRYGNRALERITQQYGLGNTVVYDPEGKPHQVDQSDKTQMEGLQSGQWKIAGAGDEGQQEALADDFEGTAESMRGSAQTLTDAAASGTTSSDENSSGKFALTPEASQLLKLLPGGGNNPSPNTNNANAGANGATHNNPPPGNSGSPSAWPTG